MNSLFHFFFNYILLQASLGNASPNMILILVSSVAIDIDHLPFILLRRKSVLSSGFGELSRTLFHELPGLLIISLLFVFGYAINQMESVRIVFLCMLLHYTVDFLSGKTRPFLPFSKKVLVSPFCPSSKKKKIIFEIIATIVAGGLFWLSLRG